MSDIKIEEDNPTFKYIKECKENLTKLKDKL